MDAVTVPEEPPVGTMVTAPRARHFWQRAADGWWVVTSDGKTKLAEGAPPGQWEKIARVLAVLGGILTVTTEYQVDYRYPDDPGLDAGPRTTQTPFTGRPQIWEWRRVMSRTFPVEVLAIRSQQVTRSAWRDEPLEETS